MSLSAYHGKVVAYVQAHPTGCAVVLALLVVLTLVLLVLTLVYHSKWKSATTSGKAGFAGRSWTGGMHSNWQNGSQLDYGLGGNAKMQLFSQTGRSTNPAVTSVSSLNSQLKGMHHMAVARDRATAWHKANKARLTRMGVHREGLTAAQAALANAATGPQGWGVVPTSTVPTASNPWGVAPSSDSSANWGTTAPSTAAQAAAAQAAAQAAVPGYSLEGGDASFGALWNQNDANTWAANYIAGTSCPNLPVDPVTGAYVVNTTTIGNPGVWDPEAMAEVQALASVGSLSHDPEDDTAMLQAAINTSLDANSAANSMSDATLASLMGSGNMP